MPKIVDPSVRREEIVAAASALVAREGPEALSMRKIAGQAGCTIGLINHWFGSKNELVRAVLDNVINIALQRSLVALEQPGASLDQVLLEFLPLESARREELRVWLVFWGLSVNHPGLRDHYRRRMRSVRKALRGELLRQGFVRQEVSRCVDVLITSIDGIVVNALTDPDYWTANRQRATLRWLLKRVT